MTSIERFVMDAVKGKWRLNGQQYEYETSARGSVIMRLRGSATCLEFDPAKFLLDPKAWEAVGKTRGWPKYACSGCLGHATMRKSGYYECKEDGLLVEELYADVGWKLKWHSFIDQRGNGKTIEEALAAIE